MSDSQLRNYVVQLATQFQDAQLEIANLKTVVTMLQNELKTEVASLKADIAVLQEEASRKSDHEPFEFPNLADKGISNLAVATPLPPLFSGCLSANTPPPPNFLLSGATAPPGVIPPALKEARKAALKADMKKSLLWNYKFTGEEKANLKPAIQGTEVDLACSSQVFAVRKALTKQFSW